MGEVERIKLFATGQLRDRVADLLDDPFGVCGSAEEVRRYVTDELVPVASDLGIDLDQWFANEGTSYERERLARILGGGNG